MVAAYFIGVGLIGAGLAALALNALWRVVGGGDPPTLVLVLVCVLGALAALSVVRYVVVFGTAIAGAWTTHRRRAGADRPRDHARASRRATSGCLYPLDPDAGPLVGSGDLVRPCARRRRRAAVDDDEDREEEAAAGGRVTDALELEIPEPYPCFSGAKHADVFTTRDR